MARGSLGWLAMALAVPACLVAGPPDYEDPRQTPPVLDLNQAEPSINQIIGDKQPGDQIAFNLPVRSEDVGDGLTAALYLDGLTTPELQTAGKKLPPSTFDDTSRKFIFTWTIPSIPAGCHRVTLLVTHSQHFDFFATPNYTDPSDIALATWWLNLSDEVDTQHPSGTNTLESCPDPSRGAP